MSRGSLHMYSVHLLKAGMTTFDPLTGTLPLLLSGKGPGYINVLYEIHFTIPKLIFY